MNLNRDTLSTCMYLHGHNAAGSRLFDSSVCLDHLLILSPPSLH